MGDETCDQRQEWAREVVNLSRERGSAAEWPLTLGAVAKQSGVSLTLLPKPYLQSPEPFLDLFAKTLDLAISPHE